MIQLEFVEAMERLHAGDVIYCQPLGYNGWWVAFHGGTLYECSTYRGACWSRSRKGVSTILGADFFEREGAPTYARAHYESESFLAHERRGAVERDMLKTIGLLTVSMNDQRAHLDQAREQLVELSKDTDERLRAIEQTLAEICRE